MEKLEEKTQKFSFSKLDLSLSVHMQSAVLLPLQTIYVPITSACHSSDFSLVGSFFVANGVTVSEFWRDLPWVSKPDFIPLLVYFVIYMQRNPPIHLC